MRIPWSARGSTRGAGRGASPPTLWRKGRLLLVPAMGLAVICQLSVSGAAGAATVASTANPASGSVKPNATNELDCNGWSAAYKTVRKLAGDTCTDPITIKNGKASRFVDNGWYIGHDEPSVKFISNTPGSGNTMTYFTKIPVDPSKSPTPSGSVTDYGQLSVAPWFGLPMCDPNSYPQNACKPDSDSNSGFISDPNAAGSAFMELQLYPPGYTPFVDSESCNATKWCAALTIDSLECSFNFATCNPNCEEPVNFSYLQTNGVPTGPPSPQLTDLSTFTPNSHTLLINPGDTLQVSIADPAAGFTTTIRDMTTGQTGWVTASAANGFMNTNINTCNGTPFTFHAEYSSAKQINQVPWAAAEGGVLMEQEIGHSESCSSLKYQDPFVATYADGQSYSDPDTYDTCVGGSEGPGEVGEGPCTSSGCQNSTTQGPNGPTACPTNDPASGALCEFADAFCFPQGVRNTTQNFGSGPVTVPESSRNDQCFANRYQNGDLDFDGLSYQSFALPNGGSNHPTAFQYVGPFQANGSPYPTIQFESDIGGSSALCNVSTGLGCVVPPISAKFYPYWTLTKNPGAAPGTNCSWSFGGSLPNTARNFGGDAEYGSADLSRYAGTIISNPMPNPAYANVCAAP
jgi:hypothetical protein